MSLDEKEAAVREFVKSDPEFVIRVLTAANNEKLIEAAKGVVDARYGGGEWDELKNAIARLASVLDDQGVKCKGVI